MVGLQKAIKSMMTTQLIITLFPHSKFGYLLQAFFAEHCSENELFTIVGIAQSDTHEFMNLSEMEKKIVRSAERFSDRALMKVYSKQKNEADFVEMIEQNTIDTYIRPFIENRHQEILQWIRITKTPLFLRQKIRDRDFRENQQIDILPNPSSMTFVFRNTEKFTYSVIIKNRDQSMDLFGKVFAPICLNPAQVIIGNELHFFNDIDEKKLRPFITKKQIEIPPNSISEYMRKFVVQCVREYDVVADGLHIFEYRHSPSAVLTLETNFQLHATLHLQFYYGNKCFETDSPFRKVVELIEGDALPSIRWYFRDEAWEKNCVKILESGGLKQSNSHLFSVKNDDGSNPYGVVEWINQNSELLRQFTLNQFNTKHRFYLGEIELRLAVDERIDWFDVNCTVVFGNIEIPFTDFKDHIIDNIREYVLPDGSVAILPSEWFVRFGELFRLGKNRGDSIRLNNYHFQVKKMVEDGFLDDENIEEMQLPTKLPAGLKATLRPYQMAGFQWLTYLRKNFFGGCLADDMGLGKTLQTIALLLDSHSEKNGVKHMEKNKTPLQLSLFEEMIPENEAVEKNCIKRDIPPSLIIMPTSLIHNWLNELEKFAPKLAVYVHCGSSRMKEEYFTRQLSRCQIILTTYGIVRQDIDLLSKHLFQYIVLDESQSIKNPMSQTFECVKQLRSIYKLSLTGTPIENSITDLWSQMDFLNEGILGTRAEFQKRFDNADFVESEQMQESLLKIVKPFILRRTKEKVAPELPSLTEKNVYCEMSEGQAMLYNEEKNKIRNELIDGALQSKKNAGIIALSRLTHLRLLANHPVILNPDFIGQSGKFEHIISLIDTLIQEQHKVLIFSSFVKHLRLFAEYFDLHQWQYAWLTGKTVNREEEIDKFNSNEAVRAFFISLKAGGTGLNLTAADYVFIIDPWWNPAAEMQAVSRAHRIGQNKKVTLYRFISKDTVEEKMLRLQQRKSMLADTLVHTQLSKDDMEDLLG